MMTRYTEVTLMALVRLLLLTILIHVGLQWTVMGTYNIIINLYCLLSYENDI